MCHSVNTMNTHPKTNAPTDLEDLRDQLRLARQRRDPRAVSRLQTAIGDAREDLQRDFDERFVGAPGLHLHA